MIDQFMKNFPIRKRNELETIKGSSSKRRRSKRPVSRMEPIPASIPPAPDAKSMAVIRGTRERRKKSSDSEPESKMVTMIPSNENNQLSTGSSLTSVATPIEKENELRLSPPRIQPAISIHEAKKLAAEWCNKILDRGAAAIGSEYKPAETTYPEELIKSFTSNSDANRYTNTVCLEPTRVIVPNGDPTDYYHANYVAFFDDKPKQYICAQGPMDTTTANFWKMILAEKISCIVMLCDLVEKGVPKCHRYYPQGDNETMQITDAITVTNRGISTFGGIEPMVVETSLLEVTDGQQTLTCRHFHWVAWPDHGVPRGTTAPVKLLSHIKATGIKALIHCSAGVGRTGTVVFFLAAVEMLKKGEHPEMMAVLKKIREQRAHCVQNELQYLYAHKVILDYFNSKGIVKDKEKLEKFYQEYETFVAECKHKRSQVKPRSVGAKKSFH